MDEPEVSLVRNSIASQEWGADYTNPFEARQLALGLSLGTSAGARWRSFRDVESVA